MPVSAQLVGSSPQRGLDPAAAVRSPRVARRRRRPHEPAREVRSARAVDGKVRLLLENGGRCSADRAVVATGFTPIFEHPFVDRIAGVLGLERGHRGMPVLEDATLAWRRRRRLESAVSRVRWALAPSGRARVTSPARAGRLIGSYRRFRRRTDHN
ncbi:hypothetical protein CHINAEXTREME_01605 [Halobiforma lacisalsi AJ5]|uniref:Uncharacterized protein n=1 Tax=Natronobacterium lacisalsi AJ5 TaxID=358396 RepID=M0LJJ7_NATLA|nr:hypothetical protein [Halobiforma lacisalsi]APW96542.1 hypothetical protein CHINAEXTREME_01605 [Halobiforma lacisalsi AJ5]EMA32180.1 hypothetical protein C445_12736 [Halobiforma lacisalsi AJ5]